MKKTEQALLHGLRLKALDTAQAQMLLLLSACVSGSTRVPSLSLRAGTRRAGPSRNTCRLLQPPASLNVKPVAVMISPEG